MNEIFDVYTLIYLVIAVVIFMRLRNALGRRTGNERKPFDPFSDSDQNESGQNESGRANETAASDKNHDDTVIPLPRRATQGRRGAPVANKWGEFAEVGSVQAAAFDAFIKISPDFDPRSFTEGAVAAYEMVVSGFAAGDKKSLKPLLSPEVYEGFVSAIASREKRGETVESKFISIDQADLEGAELKKNVGHITVRFVSKLISATHDKVGEVIDGDNVKIRSMTDVWTFARDLTSSNPNWKVVATEAAD